jgi:hypothetical protein
MKHQKQRMPTRKLKAPTLHRDLIRSKGWSLRTAAPLLGVHWTHLHHVLSGARTSRTLLARIEDLPTRDTTHP